MGKNRSIWDVNLQNIAQNIVGEAHDLLTGINKGVKESEEKENYLFGSHNTGFKIWDFDNPGKDYRQTVDWKKNVLAGESAWMV